MNSVGRERALRMWTACALAALAVALLVAGAFVSASPVEAYLSTSRAWTEAYFVNPQVAAYGPGKQQGLRAMIVNHSDAPRTYDYQVRSSTGILLEKDSVTVPAQASAQVTVPIAGAPKGAHVELLIDGWTGVLRTGAVR